MAISLETAQAHLAAWEAADLAVSQNQSYTFESSGFRRQVTRADAVEIRNNLNYWERKVAALEDGGSMRVRRVVPV